MGMKRFHIKIFGRVQGVGFRYAAKKEAEKLGVVGYARNEKDGSVFIEAQGTNERVEQFLSWCGKGPWLAKVESVEQEEKEIKEGLAEFNIK